jgi:UDPglucose 6-dehydrogenase
MRDFLNPDFTLVGQFDARSGGELEKCYAKIIQNNAPCQRMSIENAELTKIALNAFVTTKITFANMLADLCERIPGGNVDVVSEALGLDRRIGRRYLTGGLGYGGPCFPRDNVALSFIARTLGTQADLAETTDRVNRGLVDRVVERLRPAIGRGTTVAVLGLAYKPASHVIEESQGIFLARKLSSLGARVVAYDPLAAAGARAELRDHALVLDTLSDCLKQAEVVLIATPDPAFRALTADDFNGRELPVTVLDFWRILSRELAQAPRIRYIPIGCSVNDEENAARLDELWKLATPAEN